MRVLSEAVLDLLKRTSHFPDTTFQNFKLRGGGCARGVEKYLQLSDGPTEEEGKTTGLFAA